MKKLFVKTIYGVNDSVFNVGDNGVKAHFDPITSETYAYGSSANVKRNIKQLFSELSHIETPKTEFKKKASAKNKSLAVNDGGTGEQGGVAISIDVENPICAIFGAWNSDKTDDDKKYAKNAIKACFNVSDFIPVHPLLQKLSKKEKGVFVGDKNSIVTLGIDSKTLRTPEEASEYVGCSIEEAKDVFGGLRPMNLYEDKQTANGLYQQTFAINIETFGMLNLSDYEVPQDKKDNLLSNGWRIVRVNGEEYLSPCRENLLQIWEYFVNALIDWDFSSNNSLHGNIKEALRYSFSFNANKLNNCNSAVTFEKENGKKGAKLALRNHEEVFNFNSVSLEKWFVCDENTPTSMNADDEVKRALIEVGKNNIL